MTDSTQIATQTPTKPRVSVLAKMASAYDMEPNVFLATIKATVMPSGREVSNEQVAAFLSVASQYGLNPFTREIYAFPSKEGGIQQIVSIDGWMKLINNHEQFNGMSFTDVVDEAGNVVSVTCKIYRKDREHPIEATEYLSECLRGTEPWKKWPRRMLRHKAAIQAARYAFSFAGIVDPDEAERQFDHVAAAPRAHAVPDTATRTEKLVSAIKGDPFAAAPAAEIEDAVIVDPVPDAPTAGEAAPPADAAEDAGPAFPEVEVPGFPN